jgi:hypothetical protein
LVTDLVGPTISVAGAFHAASLIARGEVSEVEAIVVAFAGATAVAGVVAACLVRAGTVVIESTFNAKEIVKQTEGLVVGTGCDVIRRAGVALAADAGWSTGDVGAISVGGAALTLALMATGGPMVRTISILETFHALSQGFVAEVPRQFAGGRFLGRAFHAGSIGTDHLGQMSAVLVAAAGLAAALFRVAVGRCLEGTVTVFGTVDGGQAAITGAFVWGHLGETVKTVLACLTVGITLAALGNTLVVGLALASIQAIHFSAGDIVGAGAVVPGSVTWITTAIGVDAVGGKAVSLAAVDIVTGRGRRGRVAFSGSQTQ